MIHTFNRSPLLNKSMLGVVFDNNTYIFGIDFALKLLELKLENSTYISRSHYVSDSQRFQKDTYRGRIVTVPEQERELILNLINYPKHSEDRIKVLCQVVRSNHTICKKCKGKGFVDWVESMITPDCLTIFHNDELNPTYRSLIKEFYRFEFYNNVSVFYKKRKTSCSYLQECTICPYCKGIGFDPGQLEMYIPHPIVDQLEQVVFSTLNREIFLNQEHISSAA